MTANLVLSRIGAWGVFPVPSSDSYTVEVNRAQTADILLCAATRTRVISHDIVQVTYHTIGDRACLV